MHGLADLILTGSVARDYRYLYYLCFYSYSYFVCKVTSFSSNSSILQSKNILVLLSSFFYFVCYSNLLTLHAKKVNQLFRNYHEPNTFILDNGISLVLERSGSEDYLWYDIYRKKNFLQSDLYIQHSKRVEKLLIWLFQ